MNSRSFGSWLAEQIGIHDLRLLLTWEELTVEPDIDDNTDNKELYDYLQMRGQSQVQIDYLLNELRTEYKEEQQRNDKIESKATTIFGWTALILTVSVSGAAIVRTNPISAIFGLGAVICLVIGILLALKATRISTYPFRAPKPNVLWGSENLQRIKGMRARQLLASLQYNKKLGNRKATLVDGAQTWVRNALFLLAVMAIWILLFSPPSGPTAVSTSTPGGPTNTGGSIGTPTPGSIPTMQVTDTPVETPTETVIPTHTETPTQIPSTTVGP